MYDVHLKHFVVFHITVLQRDGACESLEGGGGLEDSSRKIEVLSYCYI